MVCSWTKEAGLANLNRSCLIGKLQSGSEQPGGESYCRHFLHMLSKFAFRPGRGLVGGKALPFSHGSRARVLDKVVPLSETYIHSGLHAGPPPLSNTALNKNGFPPLQPSMSSTSSARAGPRELHPNHGGILVGLISCRSCLSSHS